MHNSIILLRKVSLIIGRCLKIYLILQYTYPRKCPGDIVICIYQAVSRPRGRKTIQRFYSDLPFPTSHAWLSLGFDLLFLFSSFIHSPYCGLGLGIARLLVNKVRLFSANVISVF